MHSTIDFGKGDAPWLSIASQQQPDTPTIHFSAANGFPVASSREFLNCFSATHSITAMDCRGAWPDKPQPEQGFSIYDFADDLILGIASQHQSPVIGMGHSHGGLITLIAAAKRPDLFSKLVIIEPATYPLAWISYITRFVPQAVLFRFFPFIRGSHERQRYWPNREAFIERYRKHNTFKRFTDAAFADYATNGLRAHPEHSFELVFAPEWESHIFRNIDYVWKHLAETSHPTLLIRAEHSNICSRRQFITEVQSLKTNIHPIEIADTFHLLPYEAPKLVAQKALDWLAQV